VGRTRHGGLLLQSEDCEEVSRLSKTMTVRQFDHGYWYATEIKKFCAGSWSSVCGQVAEGRAREGDQASLSRSGINDVDLGLRLDLPVVLYTNDRETKAFLDREARKLDPSYKRRSGSRYRLNRWWDARLSRGVRITYRDVVREYPGTTMASAIRAWKRVKAMDSPKNYRAFARTRH
jgi:hypothetical protein